MSHRIGPGIGYSLTMSRATLSLSKLADHLAEYLAISEVSDYGPNGIQVEGTDQIGKLVTGVSSCQELFDRAHEAGADAILVHHGLFWDGMPYSLTGMQYRRVRTLIEGGMSLLAYHLPLDRHAVVGNNAVAALAAWAGRSGALRTTSGSRYRLSRSPSRTDSLPRLCWSASRTSTVRLPSASRPTPEDPVSSVAIISGGAQKELHQAVAAGLDVFVTGEASEWVMNVALESGTRFVSAGHYATERLGVQVLGERIADQFGIEVEYIDVPNPI